MKAIRSVLLVLALAGCSPGDPQVQQAVLAPANPKEEGEKAKGEPVGAVPNPVERAIELFRGGQEDEAIAVVEEHLGKVPDDARAKAVLAQILQVKAQPATKEGRWDLAGPLLLKSAKLAREVRSVKGLNVDTEGLYITTTYNEACTYSRFGEIEKALDSLEESLRAGFLEQSVSEGPTTRELFVSDTDLDAIRDTDRFRELKDRYLKEEKPTNPPSHDPSAF